MEIEVNVNPKDIEKAVTEAIVASSLGGKIKAAVQSVFQNSGYGWSDPIKREVDAVVEQEIRRLIRNEYEEQIRAKVRERLGTEELLDKMVRAAMGQIEMKFLE